MLATGLADAFHSYDQRLDDGVPIRAVASRPQEEAPKT